MRRFVIVVPLAVLAVGVAGAHEAATTPTASATAWAIKITVPSVPPITTPIAVSPPNATPIAGSAFTYPADGSVVSAQSATASASTTVQKNAGAKSESVITALSLFGGAITADGVTARASAGTGYARAGGNLLGSGVTNLKVDGQAQAAAAPGTTVPLGDWGQLTIGAESVDRTAPAGVQGYHTFVTELDIKVTVDHAGLAAGSEIQIGYAEALAQTAPPPTSTTPTETIAGPTGPSDNPTTADNPRLRPGMNGQKPKREPLKLQPKLTAGRYVFPVYGPTSYVDTFGAPRKDVSYHHGDDIFGSLGQPLVACTDGTIFSVGWNKIGGYRLWLLDAQGNQFYYAHLSAFSTAAVNGAHVRAGQVIGFMGNTGDAEGTPVHLHFEIHPVSLLYLAYDGAVDPTAYLNAWQHQRDLPFPIVAGWVPGVPGGPSAPEPGAILLGMSDISTANGLDPSSLRRALRPLKPSDLMQTLVPVSPALPTTDLGKG